MAPTRSSPINPSWRRVTSRHRGRPRPGRVLRRPTGVPNTTYWPDAECSDRAHLHPARPHPAVIAPPHRATSRLAAQRDGLRLALLGPREVASATASPDGRMRTQRLPRWWGLCRLPSTRSQIVASPRPPHYQAVSSMGERERAAGPPPPRTPRSWARAAAGTTWPAHGVNTHASRTPSHHRRPRWRRQWRTRPPAARSHEDMPRRRVGSQSMNAARPLAMPIDEPDRRELVAARQRAPEPG